VLYHRSEDPFNQAQQDPRAGNDTSYEITDLDANTEYRVYLLAINSAGSSGSTVTPVTRVTLFGGEKLAEVSHKNRIVVLLV